MNERGTEGGTRVNNRLSSEGKGQIVWTVDQISTPVPVPIGHKSLGKFFFPYMENTNADSNRPKEDSVISYRH